MPEIGIFWDILVIIIRDPAKKYHKYRVYLLEKRIKCIDLQKRTARSIYPHKPGLFTP